jgi:enoyl-CoA hydratase/carnithine racemase
VRILTNSNPGARNAITPTLYAELSAALADAAATIPRSAPSSSPARAISSAPAAT